MRDTLMIPEASESGDDSIVYYDAFKAHSRNNSQMKYEESQNNKS